MEVRVAEDEEHSGESDNDGASEHVDHHSDAEDDGCTEEQDLGELAADGAAEHGDEREPTLAPQKPKVQMFQMTISLRDDWLHRGEALQDMDLHTYVEHIQRTEKPIAGTVLSEHSQIFAFDAHYKLASRYQDISCNLSLAGMPGNVS